MKLFGRKKPEDDEEVVKKDEGKPKRRRRKKEEPPKPWGKGERIFVFGVLFSTIIIAIILALNAREWKLPGLPRIGLPKGLFEQTYVFEGKPPARDTSAVIDEFNKLTQNASGVYGLFVINLNTEESYGVNSDETFQAASLIKLPVMAAIYSEHEKGNLDLDSPAGSSEYSYRELVSAMGQRSDNAAFNLAVELLGEGFIEQYIKEIGLANTSLEENQTTPRDIGLFFKNLWERNIVERPSRDEILKSLTNTSFENWISAGIPERVAHKFGREVHVVNDAGIVYGESPYVLVIMSKGVVESEADKLFPLLAAAVHRFETGSI